MVGSCLSLKTTSGYKSFSFASADFGMNYLREYMKLSMPLRLAYTPCAAHSFVFIGEQVNGPCIRTCREQMADISLKI